MQIKLGGYAHATITLVIILVYRGAAICDNRFRLSSTASARIAALRGERDTIGDGDLDLQAARESAMFAVATADRWRRAKKKRNSRL